MSYGKKGKDYKDSVELSFQLFHIFNFTNARKFTSRTSKYKNFICCIERIFEYTHAIFFYTPLTRINVTHTKYKRTKVCFIYL